MAEVKLGGNTVNTNGDLPSAGDAAPDFTLTDAELTDVSLADLGGGKKLLSIFPSIDTPVCAMSTKKFNDYAKDNPSVTMAMISADLPFAMKRFCGDEGLDNVKVLGMMRDRSFADDYGIRLVDGPLAGITARAVMVLDADNKVLHAELVPEIGQEPDYEAALAALS